MICESCQKHRATARIIQVDKLTSKDVEHHFCASCAELFSQSDPVTHKMMIKLRVSGTSPDGIHVSVLGGRHSGQKWTFLTSRVAQLQIDPFEGYEFGIPEEDNFIEWLRGNRTAPV